MFPFRRRCNSRRCVIYLLFLLLTLGGCHDPNPESRRRSSGARVWSNVADSKEEKAFHQATLGAQQTGEEESKSKSDGRIVSERHRILDSVHEQAAVPSVIHQRKNRYKFAPEQLALKKRSASIALDASCNNETIECNATAKYRTANGTCNNLENPSWGSAGSCFLYLLEPVGTGNGFRGSERCGDLPPPRKVSMNAHSEDNKTSAALTVMHVIFGQFIAHDLTLTPVSRKENGESFQCCQESDENNPQCAAIQMPPNDPFFRRFNVTCLNFVRSASCQDCEQGRESRRNVLTSFLDGSMIYGSSDEQMRSLRTNDGTGKLRGQSTPHGELLPKSNEEGSVECSNASMGNVNFEAGDGRVNQHASLTMVHTLFHRVHNQIAGQLKILNPDWDDEKIYQVARKITVALLQWITYYEYLPLLMSRYGMDLYKLNVHSGCTPYNSKINPTMYTDFAAAAFRVPHTMVYIDVNNEGVQLRDTYSNNTSLCEGKMDNWVRGMTMVPAKHFNRHMVADVTKYMYRRFGQLVGEDLASTDVQRGRDHGLQSYINYVEFCTQIKIGKWEDLVRHGLMTENTTQLLRCLYRSPSGIDLYTGLVSEIPREGQMIGPTSICINGNQFHNLRYGDRLFYDNCEPHRQFSEAQLQQIKKTSLAKLICDNLNVRELQQKVMEQASESNRVVNCDEMPEFDFQPWKEEQSK